MFRKLTEEDRFAVMAYLHRNEEETTFIYGNVVRFGLENRSDCRRCADYYGYYDETGRLQGILPFYNLGSCIPHFEDDKAIPFFAECMVRYPFRDLLGMKHIVQPLADAFSAFRKAEMRDESVYMRLDSMDQLTPAAGVLRDPRVRNPEDIAFIMEARKALGNKGDESSVRLMLNERGEEEDFLLLEMSGEIVSQACIQTYTETICQIGGVYTREDLRRNGYARVVVSELCRRAFSRQKTPTLFVHKTNLSAVRAYEGLGFERHEDYMHLRYAAAPTETFSGRQGL